MKRYVRKFAPPDVPQLLRRIREATAKVTGDMIAGWFKKAGFIVLPHARARVPAHQEQPVQDAVDRCSLPVTARFHRKEHIACMDAAGMIRREKKTRRVKWSRYDRDVEELLDVSAVGRTRVAPAKQERGAPCQLPEDGNKTRRVGLRPEPPGLQHRSYGDLLIMRRLQRWNERG